jgi:hypothetical protein
MNGAPLSVRDVPDCLFPTDNDFGIPVLDLRYEAVFVDLPVRTWGSTSRNQKMPGTWHFYTDDYRFSALWTDPSPLINSLCVAAVECNFTTSEQMPAAVAIYRTYQKRWLARFWQAHGVRVFVDLNVAPEWYDLNLQGVPRGWRAYMTRGYADRLDSLDNEYCLACERAGTEDILFAVYGGGKPVAEWCRSRGVIHVPETMAVRKELVKDGR